MTAVLAVVGIGVILATAAIRQRVRVRAVGAPAADRAPTLYELAHLAGGPERVALTAASYLVWSGAFETRENTKTIVLAVRPEKVADDLRPVEIAMINASSMSGTPVSRIMTAGKLAAAGSVSGPLAVDPATARLLLGLPVLVGTVVGAGVAMVAILTGESSWLVPITALFGIGLVTLGVIDHPTATTAGDAVLIDTRRQLDEDIDVASVGVTSLPMSAGMRFVALYGKDVLNGELSGLRSILG